MFASAMNPVSNVAKTAESKKSPQLPRQNTSVQPTATQINAFRIAANASETLHVFAHDPSMALFRIQEHVKKQTPILTEKKVY